MKTDGSNSVDVPALIRLPKADTQYDYYQWDNTSPADGKLTHSVVRTTTPRTSYPLPSRYPAGITDNYRFVVDDPEADGILTVDISDLQQQDGYILVGNPYMASLRMDEFFKGQAPYTIAFSKNIVKKHPDIIKQFNAALKELKENGTLDQLKKEYVD